jgi:hypothetical protein
LSGETGIRDGRTEEPVKIKIDFWLKGKEPWETEAANIKDALEIGVKGGVDFSYARLDLARLDGARLVDANLDGASLDHARLDGARLVGARLDLAKNLTLPTGETWEEYLTRTVPALLTAGGRTLDEVANLEHWGCHDWSNCPIRAAFGVDSTDKVPPLYRQHARQFVALFDAGQIPLERVNPKMAVKGKS